MFRPTTLPGGGSRAAIPILAIAGLAGGTYYFSRTPARSREEAKRERAEHTRSQGLSGAGVGGTAVTGGHETGQPGSGHPEGGKSPTSSKVNPDAPPDKLPSGGVGGGVGGGGANARTIETSKKKDSSGAGAGGNASSFLQGAFGTGGSGAGDRGTDQEQKKFADTKVHSNHTDTPTKNTKGAPMSSH